MAAPIATRHTKIKSAIWAASFFAVITVGTLTGATLKNDQQKADAIKNFRETTPAEQIAMLEDQKLVLLDNRAVLQRKLDVFQDRVRQRDAEKQSGTTTRK